MGIQPARAQPLIILTPVRRLWGVWLRFSWPAAERRGPVSTIVKKPFARLRFIHFGHWGLLSRMPAHGGRRLPHPYVVFSTNFNGDADVYIDAFSLLIPGRMRLLWQGAYGFPGPEPLGRFRAYITGGVTPTQHFYCAYPDASVKMILAGLELQEAFDALLRHAREDDDERFTQRWARFTAEHGDRL